METVEAIKAARKEQKHKRCELLFVTRCGNPWVAVGARADSAITKEFRKLLESHDLYRKG